MKMFLNDVSLVRCVNVLICESDKDLFADLDADPLTLGHKQKINGLDHDEEQLSKINRLKFQYLIVFFSRVESLDMVETLSAFLQQKILQCKLSIF